MYWVVDQVTSGIAVLIADSGAIIRVNGRGLREGWVFRLSGRRLVRDKGEEKRRSRQAAEQLRRLKASDPGGDIQL